MMHAQGSLLLSLSRREHGARGEKAAAKRLTLALRHLEKTYSPSMLRGASPAMHVAAATSRLELSAFYFERGGVHNLESAVAHTRAGGQLLAEVELAECDENVSAAAKRTSAEIAQMHERSLRELLRLAAVSGPASKRDQLRAEYTRLLHEMKR